MTAPETFTAPSKRPLTTGRRPDTTGVRAEVAPRYDRELCSPREDLLSVYGRVVNRSRRAHSSIPALRKPSKTRQFISVKRGSPRMDVWCAFHAAIVLSGPVEGSAR
jgi:hypothetical protein